MHIIDHSIRPDEIEVLVRVHPPNHSIFVPRVNPRDTRDVPRVPHRDPVCPAGARPAGAQRPRVEKTACPAGQHSVPRVPRRDTACPAGAQRLEDTMTSRCSVCGLNVVQGSQKIEDKFVHFRARKRELAQLAIARLKCVNPVSPSKK